MIAKVFAILKRAINIPKREIAAFNIRLFKRYEKITAPMANHLFRKSLCSETNAIVKLLSLNKNAANDAEMILQGRFKVFSLIINFHDYSLPWHTDFRTGKTFFKRPFPKIKILENAGYDVISPWEFSRMQFVPTLIQAYRLTGDEKFPSYFKTIFDNWITENPYLMGINWKIPMEVGLRAINLGLGFLFFNDLFSKNDIERYYKVLWAHAVFIYQENIKNKPSKRNNHFLVSLVSLLVISLSFVGKKPERFFSLAIRKLEQEIVRQFRPDGGNFESANHYHQLALEAILVAMCFLTTASNTRAGNALPLLENHQIRARIFNAIELVADYHHTFHQSPQFGDSSDGRILIYKDYFNHDALDHHFFKELTDELFPDQNIFKERIANYVYPASGIGFFANENYGICINNSPVDKEEGGGHSHCDKGSLVVRIGEASVLIDSGTWCYTSNQQQRLEHRSTRSHNVIMIDKKEQFPFNEKIAFSPFPGCETLINFVETARCLQWALFHNSHQYLEGIKTIRRTIRCFERTISIEDDIYGIGRHLIELIFNIHPDIDFEIHDNEVLLNLPSRASAIITYDPKLKISVENSFYSRSYGVRTANKRIVASLNCWIPVSLKTTIACDLIENANSQESISL